MVKSNHAAAQREMGFSVRSPWQTNELTTHLRGLSVLGQLVLNNGTSDQEAFLVVLDLDGKEGNVVRHFLPGSNAVPLLRQGA